MSVAADKVRRPLVLVCIMLTVFMAAIEMTIVATAMPQIVGRLGGFELYGWVFAAVLLAQAATTVIFGKLADLYGRKPVLIAGIVIFLVGSIFCGFAVSMPMLIAFRIVQGLGAGSMQSVSMTIMGDLYTPEERTRVQGFVAAVWGISALIGPLAGGIIVERLSWPWIFWINIPFGIAAIAGLTMFLHERVEHRKSPIDYAGAFLVSVAIASLLLVLTIVGQPRIDMPALLLFAALFVVSIPLLLWQERRAPDPIIALRLWLHRAIASANAATLAAGLTFMAATTFLPVYVQAVMGKSATTAGIALTVMAIGWPIAATISPRFYRRIGMQATARLGGVLVATGIAGFLLLRPDSSPLIAALASLVAGFGLGFLMVTCVVIVQGSVEWRERGSATAANVFARTLGNTMGASVLGSILNLALYRGSGGVITPEDVRRLLGHEPGAAAVDANLLHAALDHGLHLTFWAMFLAAAVTAVLAFTIPARQLHELSGGIRRGQAEKPAE
jgi:EmrB/QacA subfamily drug resistance transporter